MSDSLRSSDIYQDDEVSNLTDQLKTEALHEQGNKVDLIFRTVSQYNVSTAGTLDPFVVQDTWSAVCQSAGYKYNRATVYLHFNVPADVVINTAVVSYWFAPSILRSNGAARMVSSFLVRLWSITPPEYPADKTTYQLFDDSTHADIYTGQENAIPRGFLLPDGTTNTTGVGDTTITSLFASTYTLSGLSVFDPAIHTVAAIGSYKPYSAALYSTDIGKLLTPATSYVLALTTLDSRNDYCTLVSGRIEIDGYTRNR